MVLSVPQVADHMSWFLEQPAGCFASLISATPCPLYFWVKFALDSFSSVVINLWRLTKA